MAAYVRTGRDALVGYVTNGTRDLARGAKFYDPIGKELGVGRMMETERFIAWGKPGGGAGLALTWPYDGKPATVGNGVVVALKAEDDEPELDRRIQALARDAGLLIYGRRTHAGRFGDWIMVAPPLIASRADVDEIVAGLGQCLEAFAREFPALA